MLMLGLDPATCVIVRFYSRLSQKNCTKKPKLFENERFLNSFLNKM